MLDELGYRVARGADRCGRAARRSGSTRAVAAAAAVHRSGGAGEAAGARRTEPRAEVVASARAITARTRRRVILRNILENPAWYTAYTPYQPEISQGRLEALLNFQTMVCDLTGMAIANASMLDEATAAAEAMTLCQRVGKSKSTRFFVADDVFAQTLDVVRTRAQPLGIDVVVGPAAERRAGRCVRRAAAVSGRGRRCARLPRARRCRCTRTDALVVVAADLLALTLLAPPGEWGADVVVGSSQRFGVPMGFGGPHAGFLATRDEFKRSLPGRLVGVTVDAQGDPRTGSRCRRASSTSAAKRRRRTSARRRCCWR